MKTVLIIGSAGFIGSHLCDKFLSEGFRVVGIDDLSTGNKKNLSQASSSAKFSLLKQDISQKNCIRKISNQFDKICFKPEIVVHLAAKKIPRYGKRLQTLIVNTEGTKNMLELAVKFKSKFVFASTSDVYGMNPDLPFSEESNSVIGPSTVARWAYAVSKMFDEQLIFAINEEFKIPVVIVRYFGSYGPRHHRSWWGGPQSVFIDAALKNQPLPIHGDGKQTRSFCYIEDTIDGTFLAATNKKASGEIINIGNDKEILILAMAKIIIGLIPESISKIEMVPYKSFTGKKYQDVRRRAPNITKAKSILGWSPKISLRQGLARAIDWHRQNPSV
jgi:UDP-glucose 4-epimerase